MSSLEEALARVPMLDGASAADATRLGGLTNLNYLVAQDGDRYVVRIPGSGTSEYIDRGVEQHAAQSAADAGVNVPVVFFDASDGLMVTKFLEGSVTMSPERFKDLQAVARAGETLRRLHTEAKAFANDFKVFDLIDEYLALLSAKGFELPAVYRDCEQAASDSRDAVVNSNTPLVPSHCDPLCENFLDTDDRMYLIDYEYAGNNDPMWDLGDLSIEANFGAEQDAVLLRAYLGAEPRPDEEGRMVVFKALCDLVWGLWGLLQHANENPAEDFLTYGVGRLERCLALMTQPNYRDHLDAIRAAAR